MPRALPVRVPTSAFRLDAARLRRGDFTDRYFLNIRAILARLARKGYRYAGRAPLRPRGGPSPDGLPVGDARVEMQFFTRRRPFSIACGLEHARALLETAAGGFEAGGRWRRASGLEAWAVPEGTRLRPGRPALRLRGRYRDFCILETPLLGVLARETRVATNVHRALAAAGGKPVFFFPARMDLPAAQASDGWAYRVAVEARGRETGKRPPLLVSTTAQADRWGGTGSGTVAHAYILCFLGDTAEAMLRYAESLPADVKRIALVDTTGDCVGESLRTARVFLERHLAALRAGDRRGAERFRLHGVRADTPREVRDRAVPSTGRPEADRGVNLRLVRALREALDGAAGGFSCRPSERTAARDYVRGIGIVVSGGFDAERIARFERARAPVDLYGVGSWFLREGPNDYTADVVRLEVGGRWVRMAKAGRRPVDNPDLRRLL